MPIPKWFEFWDAWQMRACKVRPELDPNKKDLNDRQVVRIFISGELLSDGKKTGNPGGAYGD
jgi:hypothetical protein